MHPRRGAAACLVTSLLVALVLVGASARAQDTVGILFTSNDQSGTICAGQRWSDIYVLDGGEMRRITNALEQIPDAEAFCRISYVRPVYSADGSKIAAIRYEGSSTSVIVMNADGSDHRPVGYEGEGHALVASWSPDGTRL